MMPFTCPVCKEDMEKKSELLYICSNCETELRIIKEK